MPLNKKDYFYNATTRKVVAVFGSIFNSIYIHRQIGEDRSSSERVPLMFAPRNKLLERVESSENISKERIAIRLPRMSFEMTSLSFDENARLNRINKIPLTSETTIWNSVPYIMGMTLNVVSNSLEDVLQIVEQIIPMFSPEYSLSVNDIEAPGKTSDLSIKLVSVSPSDEYEGEVASRRIVLWTLDFEIKVRFAGAPVQVKRIESVDVNFLDLNNLEFMSNLHVDSDGRVTITNDYEQQITNDSP
jgi:hypothetical protein